jgi:hypothetical protein
MSVALLLEDEALIAMDVEQTLESAGLFQNEEPSLG